MNSIKCLLAGKLPILLSILFTNLVFSASVNDDPSSFPVLSVDNTSGSNSTWGNSVVISVNDKLAFNLHYFSDYGGKAENLTFFLESLNGKSFLAGENKTVFGKITSTTVQDKSGSVKVKFNENVKLNLYNVSWQKWPCKLVECETKLPQPYKNVINGKGLNIGLVDGDNDKHYAGNLLVEFKAVKADDNSTLSPSNNVVSDENKSGFDQIIDLLKSINFWTILGVIVSIITAVVGTVIKVKEYKKKHHND